MQILPATAYFIAHLSGGSRFTASDLATPGINVAYGSYYLRYLLDHYDGNEMLAVAAYNGGPRATWTAGWPRRGRRATADGRRRSRSRDARIRAARAGGPARLPRHLPAASSAAGAVAPGRALATVEAMPDFKLDSVFTPTADQPQGDRSRWPRACEAGERFQTLLGATGTGKTMTMAGVIEAVQRPTLVIAHNKTLAAQLCNEFRTFFPDNAVEYFVSYYDYYQPEAYVPEPGPVHREGLGDQPGGRPAAPRGHGRGVRAPGRDRGGLGVVHLRPGLAGDVRDEHADPQARRGDRPRRAAAQTRLDPVHAQRHGALARHLPGARRDARGVPGLRRDGLPGDACSATRSSACSTSTRSPAS